MLLVERHHAHTSNVTFTLTDLLTHVKGYPTWEINGELYPGEKSLDELGELSGFKG